VTVGCYEVLCTCTALADLGLDAFLLTAEEHKRMTVGEVEKKVEICLDKFCVH